MSIDVTAERVVARPRAAVFAFATDPANDAKWTGIQEARALEPGPVGLGSRVQRVARFLGKEIRYTLEVVAWEPGALMAMETHEGPFPMIVHYMFTDAPGGRTRAGIRVQGSPKSKYGFSGRLMAWFVRMSLKRDLRALARILEDAST